MSLEQLLLIYLALTLQLAAVALLLTAGWRLAAWLWPGADWGERLAATGMVVCSLAVVLVIVPGVLGLLHPLVLGAEVLTVWALVRWRLPVPAPLPKLDIPRGLRGPLLLAGLVALPFLVRSLLLVELAWDSLIYHLYFPAVWIQQQRVFLVDGVIPLNYVAFYPKNHELISTFLMGIGRNDLFVKLVNLPLLGLTALTVGLVCYQLAGSRRAAWCAGLFALTIPAQFCWAATTYVEPLLNFSLVASVYFVCRAWQSEPDQLWRAGVLAGLALGMAVGTKYTALYQAVLVVLVVLALPLDRRLPWRALMRFALAFAAAGVLTGIWWLAINTAVTGNPVYPNRLGFLPHMIDPDQPAVLEESIWNNFADMAAEGHLWAAWFGEMPSLDDPQQLGFGPKLLLLAPLLLFGLCWCLGRGLFLARRRDVTSAAPYLIVAASMVVLTYTYLKIPFLGGSMYFQVRFAPPLVLLGIAMGFALLAHLGLKPVLVPLVWIGLIMDAVGLDLRFPGLDRWTSIGLLAVMATGAVVAWLWVGRKKNAANHPHEVTCPSSPLSPADGGEESGVRGMSLLPSPPEYRGREVKAIAYSSGRRARVAVLVSALVVLIGLFAVLAYREHNRYYQYAYLYEVHGGVQDAYVPAAEWLQTHHPGAPVAYTGTFAAFLYLFVGPQLERPIFYVPTYDGPVASYLKNGELREVVDRAAWEKNLKASGARFLIVFRLFRSFWTEEDQWARELSFPLVHENKDYYRLYEVRFPEQPQADAGDRSLPPAGV